MDQATFSELATKAKQDCPVSRLLNAEITMDATLKSERMAAVGE
jgi:osmotically inducible protein OsmC